MRKARILTIVMILILALVFLTVSLTFAQTSEVGLGEGERNSAESQQPPDLEQTSANIDTNHGQGGITYCSNQNLPIPDNWPYGITGTIFLTNSLIITDLNILITTTHSLVGDLVFKLYHPDPVSSGITSAVPFNRPGFPATSQGCTGDNIAVTINDEGKDGNVEDTCDAGVPAITGNLVGGDPPDTSLMAAFDGFDIANVYWGLLVIDKATGNTGTLDAWCMVINSNEAPGIEVNPDSLSSVQLPDMVVTKALTISNAGNLNLHWTIAEEGGIVAKNSSLEEGGCSPNDIPWLSVNPITGTTSPGNSDQIDVTFDSMDMVADVFSGSLCIQSNDSVDPVIFVPITLTVKDMTLPIPEIVLTKTVGLDNLTCAETSNLTVGQPNTNVYYCFTVENTGNVTFTIHDLFDDELGYLLDGHPQVLTPGQIFSYYPVTVMITGTTTNVATWTALDPANSQTATATATATVTESPTGVSLSGFSQGADDAMRTVLFVFMVGLMLAAVFFIGRRNIQV
jgi:subtilisin-like proprotein convertase family protein